MQPITTSLIRNYDPQELSEFLAGGFHQIKPFDPLLMDYCDLISKTIFNDQKCRHHPELQALAFWLRKGHILEMKEMFFSAIPENCLLAPRGLAFHIPPSNVDTMFVYSWMLSLLAGNANIVRMPSKRSPAMELLVEILEDTLRSPGCEEILAATYLISYAHEEHITETISARTNLRIVWGGDHTVRQIRKIPLNPSAKEVVFGDRFSYAVINLEAYVEASAEEKQRLISNFCNDVFFFDQAACSSPRALFWIGRSSLGVMEVHDFYDRLNRHVQNKMPDVSLGAVLMKQNHSYGQAAIGNAKKCVTYSNALSVLEIEAGRAIDRTHCGNGLLYHIALGRLSDLADYVSEKDQTLAYYGFGRQEMKEFALRLNGRGIDRMVPIGKALDFSPLWDGCNLFTEFTRHIAV